jgi:hypothetical protein
LTVLGVEFDPPATGAPRWIGAGQAVRDRYLIAGSGERQRLPHLIRRSGRSQFRDPPALRHFEGRRICGRRDVRFFIESRINNTMNARIANRAGSRIAIAARNLVVEKAGTPMTYAREVDRRIEKGSASAHNVVTLRAVPHHADTPDPATEMRGTVDAVVSFVLNVLFDGNRSKAEIRIARAMFRPSASIVLIPRDRPSLACAVGVDEFFAADKDMLSYEESWEESCRVHDPCADSGSRMRIYSHILLDPRINIRKPRSTEVVFALRKGSSAQRIHSCAIVYDEAPRTSSPVTLFA